MRQSFVFIFMFCSVLYCGSIKVDRYGQDVSEYWKSKITCDEDLRADAQNEELPVYPLFDPALFDCYGGILALGNYNQSQHFRLMKKDGRWWFVTPAGHLFFAIGCDAVDANESGYSTPTYEEDGVTLRSVFEELPDKADFPLAYLFSGRKVSFLSANLKRKYDGRSDFMDKVHDVNARRLKKWKFNSTPKWGNGTCIGMPFIDDIYLADVSKFDRYIDCYAEDFPQKAEATIKRQIERSGNNQMLLGFSIENENGWSVNAIRILTGTPREQPAKTALVDFLIERLGEKEATALFSVSSRKEMLENQKEIMLESSLVNEFIALSSRKYHAILQEIYHRLAPGILWFGAAHCTGQDNSWIEAGADYVDCIQLNEYSIIGKWSKTLMSIFDEKNKPFFITEYSFVCNTRGMDFYNEYTTMSDEVSRGRAYRHYAEMQAANPYCIGLGYFIFYDQPSCMRTLPNGEAHNFGLVSQQDQPYDNMLNEVVRGNERLVDLHCGKGSPFVFENWENFIDSIPRNDITAQFLMDSISRSVIEDRSQKDFFDGVSCRLTLKAGTKREKIAIGTIALDTLDGKSPCIQFFLWHKRRGIPLDNFIMLEISEDGEHFQRIDTACYLINPGVFDHFELEPLFSLPPKSRFLRVILCNPEPDLPWITQYAGVASFPFAGRIMSVAPNGLPKDYKD